MAFIYAPLQAQGKPLVRFFGSDDDDATMLFSFLEALSCMLAASPMLDLEMFSVWLVWLAPLLGSGLVV